MDALRTFFAIAGTVVAVLGLGAGVYYFRYQKRRNQLRISLTSRAIISSHSPKEITVNYAGARLLDPYVVTIRIMNAGPKDIRSDDFDAGAAIQLELGVPPINITDEADGRELDFELVNTRLDIKPILLTTNRAYTISLLCNGLPSPQLTRDRIWGTDVSITGDATVSRLRELRELVQAAPGQTVLALLVVPVVLLIAPLYFSQLPEKDPDPAPQTTTTVTVTSAATPGTPSPSSATTSPSPTATP